MNQFPSHIPWLTQVQSHVDPRRGAGVFYDLDLRNLKNGEYHAVIEALEDVATLYRLRDPVAYFQKRLFPMLRPNEKREIAQVLNADLAAHQIFEPEVT